MMITTAKYAVVLAALAGATILLTACGREGKFSSVDQAMDLLGYGPAVLHNALVDGVAGSTAGAVPDGGREEPAAPWIAATEARHFEVYSNYVAYLAQVERSVSSGDGGERAEPSWQADEAAEVARLPLRHCDPRFAGSLRQQ